MVGTAWSERPYGFPPAMFLKGACTFFIRGTALHLHELADVPEQTRNARPALV